MQRRRTRIFRWMSIPATWTRVSPLYSACCPNTYDCIISRGGTATLIRQVTDLPVVEIHISVYDVLRTMKLAENYSSLYAIVGFPSVTEAAHTLCDLLGYTLNILTVQCADEVPVTLERLKEEGYRMVVCDMVTHTGCAPDGAGRVFDHVGH